MVEHPAGQKSYGAQRKERKYRIDRDEIKEAAGQTLRDVSAEDSLSRAEELLARLEKTRAELERLSQANDAEKALDVLTELSELSKAIEDELQKVKRNAETDAEP